MLKVITIISDKIFSTFNSTYFELNLSGLQLAVKMSKMNKIKKFKSQLGIIIIKKRTIENLFIK